MPKEFILLTNEYEKIKNKPTKKPRWIGEQNTSFFHTFSQTETRTKNEILAEKKLAMVDLSFGILQEKYKNFTDYFIHIFDLSGCTLWVNDTMRNSSFKSIEDPYMMHNFLNFIEMNEKDPELYKSLKDLLSKYPSTLEVNQKVNTTLGELYSKGTFVIL